MFTLVVTHERTELTFVRTRDDADSTAKKFMGFYYRKSVRAGPFRINLSKSGVGFSVGGPGFRTGVSGRGRRYSTFSVPGTGVGYRTSGSGSGCVLVLCALLLLSGLIGKALL